MRFGKWVFWTRIVTFLDQSVDSLVIGKLLGATALGFYQMAYLLALLPTSRTTGRVQGILFPAFAKLQEERDLRRAFLRSLAVVASLTVPLGCFLTIFADPLVRFILGERWLSIAPALRILAWAGVAITGGKLMSALFLAIGRPDLQLKAALLKVLVLAVSLYPVVTTLGITGVALAVTTSSFVALTYQVLHVTQLVRLRGRQMVKALGVGAVGSVPFLAAGLAVPSTLSPALFLIAGVAIGLYLVILLTALPRFGIGFGLWSSHQP